MLWMLVVHLCSRNNHFFWQTYQYIDTENSLSPKISLLRNTAWLWVLMHWGSCQSVWKIQGNFSLICSDFSIALHGSCSTELAWTSWAAWKSCSSFQGWKQMTMPWAGFELTEWNIRNHWTWHEQWPDMTTANVISQQKLHILPRGMDGFHRWLKVNYIWITRLHR